MSWWKKHAPWSLCNTDQEIHAWWIGYWETFPLPWPARYRSNSTSEYRAAPELHYYLWGRSMGFLSDIALYIGLYRFLS